MSEFRKRGLAKRTVKYFDKKENEEKNRYVIVGDYYATDHGSRKAIRLNATATTEEVWINIYEDEERSSSETHEFNKKVHDVAPEDIDDKPIDLNEIPF